MTSSLTYIPLFWKFSKVRILELKQGTFYQKKIFFNVRGKKRKNLKIRDIHLLELFNYHHLSSFIAICITDVFLTNFQTSIFSHQSRGRWRHQIVYVSNFLHESDFVDTKRHDPPDDDWCPEGHAKFHVDIGYSSGVIPEKPWGVITPPPPHAVKG